MEDSCAGRLLHSCSGYDLCSFMEKPGDESPYHRAIVGLWRNAGKFMGPSCKWRSYRFSRLLPGLASLVSIQHCRQRHRGWRPAATQRGLLRATQRGLILASAKLPNCRLLAAGIQEFIQHGIPHNCLHVLAGFSERNRFDELFHILEVAAAAPFIHAAPTGIVGSQSVLQLSMVMVHHVLEIAR